MLTPLLFALALGIPEVVDAQDPPYVDTRVGPVRLGDYASGKAFVEQFGGTDFETDGGLPVFRCFNAAETEVLDLVWHPGDSRHDFMQFRIRRANGPEREATPLPTVDTFTSGRGVHLGLSITEVIQLLGEPHEQSDGALHRTLIYRCSSSAVCPSRKKLNMPEYEGKYVFREGILIRCEWGYPYP